MTLLLENPGCSLRRVERAVQIDPHNLTPLLGGIVFGSDRRGDSRISHQNIQLTKVLHHLLNHDLDGRLASHIGLIRRSPDIVCGCDFCGGLVGCLGGIVDQRDLG